MATAFPIPAKLMCQLTCTSTKFAVMNQEQTSTIGVEVHGPSGQSMDGISLIIIGDAELAIQV